MKIDEKLAHMKEELMYLSDVVHQADIKGIYTRDMPMLLGYRERVAHLKRRISDLEQHILQSWDGV